MVDLKRVFKKYNHKKVINDVSVSVEKGTITSFIGPNGAGKSTLISMISRLIAKDEGDISIDGKDITRQKNNDMAKKISILKQSNNLNLRLTIRELVSFGRFPYSQGRLSREDWAKVDEAIDYMVLRDMRDKDINELSGVQRKQAQIVMIIAQDTEYILLNEPLNNLDMRHYVKIMKTLRRLVHEIDKTILHVMHDINYASCYSVQIVALKDGEVVN